jgi:uncharacterized membrane protein (UPF0127 family)
MRRLAPLFAGAALVAACASTPARTPALFPSLQQAKVQVTTASGVHEFGVWIAADDESRERGLMHVRELPPDTGMLFVFELPQAVSFWMKNTYLSLDLAFIAPDGTVVNVAADATPLSLEPIESAAPVLYVLELAAGTAARIGLEAGDRITLVGRLARP